MPGHLRNFSKLKKIKISLGVSPVPLLVYYVTIVLLSILSLFALFKCFEAFTNVVNKKKTVSQFYLLLLEFFEIEYI